MHFALLAWPATGHPHHLPDFAQHRPHAPSMALAQRLPALARLLATALALLMPSASRAAGGHHAVDDATLLDPGQCQLETWLEDGAGHRLQHLGPACRLGGIEAGLNLDRYRLGDTPTTRLTGAQLKWAHELQPGLSWGLAWAAAWQNDSPRFAGQALLLPLTWAPRSDLNLHLNLGRDFHPGRPDHWRYGAALEWQPSPQWQGVAEHWRDGFRLRHRLGLRHIVNDALSLDLSRAQARGAPRDAWWTVGVNWVFSH